jgi:hypothetical protein
MDADIHLEETPFGFAWGNAIVSRICSLNGHRWIEVQTGRQILSIRITPSGLIRTNLRTKDCQDKTGPLPKILR